MGSPQVVVPERSPASVGELPAPRIRRWPRAVGFLFWLWSLLATAVATTLLGLIEPLVMSFGNRRRRAWWVEQTWATMLHAVAGIRVETVFEASVPEGPVVFVANHQGNYDITALFLGLGRPFVFAAKKAVFGYPFLGRHIRAAGFIPVDRCDRAAALKSLEEGAAHIRAGTSVAFFPEGTRSRDGSILPFKKGPFLFALKAGVPVIPVAIEGSLQVNPKRTWYVCPNTIRIVVGPAIPTEGLDPSRRDELVVRARSEVVRLHPRLGGLGGDAQKHIAAAGFEGE